MRRHTLRSGAVGLGDVGFGFEDLGASSSYGYHWLDAWNVDFQYEARSLLEIECLTESCSLRSSFRQTVVGKIKAHSKNVSRRPQSLKFMSRDMNNPALHMTSEKGLQSPKTKSYAVLFGLRASLENHELVQPRGCRGSTLLAISLE